MNRLVKKSHNQQLRSHRVRARITGTPDKPRLSVHISNHHITAQIIDDTKSQTLAYVSTVGKQPAKGTMTEQAAKVGEDIATKAISAKVKRVVLDRGSRLYHGRVQALADAARAKGLEF